MQVGSVMDIICFIHSWISYYILPITLNNQWLAYGKLP